MARVRLNKLGGNSQAPLSCNRPDSRAHQQPSHLTWYACTQTRLDKSDSHALPANEDASAVATPRRPHANTHNSVLDVFTRLPPRSTIRKAVPSSIQLITPQIYHCTSCICSMYTKMCYGPNRALKWRMLCHYALCAQPLYLWKHGSRALFCVISSTVAVHRVRFDGRYYGFPHWCVGSRNGDMFDT